MTLSVVFMLSSPIPLFISSHFYFPLSFISSNQPVSCPNLCNTPPSSSLNPPSHFHGPISRSLGFFVQYETCRELALGFLYWFGLVYCVCVRGRKREREGEKEMALAGEEKNSLLYESMENLGPENHHLIRPSSGGGGAAATPPGFGGGSKAVANYGRNNLAGIRYRECLKNHAAAIGGNVTDGCGEFMPSGEDGSLEAFKCAACSCHRNFHRKEGAGGGDMVVHPLQLTPAPPLHGSGAGWSSAVKMAFGGGGGSGGSAATDSSSGEELNFNAYQSGGGTAAVPPQFVLAKKRHRTKFSVDQKEKMLAFAEKLGWRIPREDDTEVQRFCSEVGVKRQVFKVWMHNNKNSSSAKKTTTPTHPHPQDHHHHHHLQPPQQQQQIHQDNSRINNHE